MSEPITEDQFRKNIYRKYTEHFEHIYALHQIAESAIQTYSACTPSHYEASLALIFGRAYKAYDSIRRLCEVASSEDAGVLLRSLLNLMAVTRWISLDPKKRAKRYFDWYWVSLKAFSEKFAHHIPPSWLPTVQKRFDAVKSQFEYRTSKNRPKFAEQWYQPEARSIRDLFGQVDLAKHYNEAYSPLSSIEHSDVNGFFAMTAKMDKHGHQKQIEVQSDLFVPHYLRNAFQYFADIFRICNKTISLTDKSELEATIEAGMQFYARDMKARGMSPH